MIWCAIIMHRAAQLPLLSPNCHVGGFGPSPVLGFLCVVFTHGTV